VSDLPEGWVERRQPDGTLRRISPEQQAVWNAVARIMTRSMATTEEELMAGTRKGTTGKSGVIRSTGGQNKPVGGTGGGGGARGQANLSTLGKTTPGGRGPVPKAK
jgi:hypothetical protein